jgi:L-lactate dehydrogenase complex protein LldG
MDLASGGSVAWGPDDPGEAALRDAEVGVDEADGLIAETGTVVRTFPSRERARVSLVPPVAVFLATPETLVATVGDALARVANRHEEGRAVTAFVTGPSRTADIEKRLVIPAHGPRELVVVWLGGDPDA